MRKRIVFKSIKSNVVVKRKFNGTIVTVRRLLIIRHFKTVLLSNAANIGEPGKAPRFYS